MRRPAHALRFSGVSDGGGDGRHSLASGGDGRESLASEATGRTSSLAESLTFTRSLALDPDLVRGVAADEVLQGLGRMFHASAPGPLASVAFVACVLSLSLANFSLGREFCRATVGYGCLRG